MASNSLRYSRRRLPLTLAKILAWADAYYRRVGTWPSVSSGAVAGAAGETWAALNMALRLGLRGLAGGDSLARLLARRRGVPERRGAPSRPDRRREATRLRRQGLSLAAIGRELGVSRQRVSKLLQPPAAAASQRKGKAS